ncbi:MAG TPA: alkaline phosphatase family protein [Myxococcaceae bacterium]|nr:alkaline phosphatase family protein [Myxococcaceae bacterium]
MQLGQGEVSVGVGGWAASEFARLERERPREAIAGRSRPRRLLLIHLDGIPRTVLEQAFQDGSMPFMGRLLRSGRYRLDGAFWGSPASTPAFQAGLLYGLRHPDLPAYHWYDRELGRTVHMSTPSDALAIEQRLDRREDQSLLRGGGVAYLSLFRAHAENQAAMTALADLKGLLRDVRAELGRRRGVASRGLLASVGHAVADTTRAMRDAWAWGRSLGGDYRHEREYLKNRFLMMQLAWPLAHARALVDMVRGVPMIYLVFGNFDEVAHRRGPFSPQAKAELVRVDRGLEELYAFARLAQPSYDVVFVTDHGHVESVPFEQRQRRSIADALMGSGEPAALPAALEAALRTGGASSAMPTGEARRPELVEAGNFAHLYVSPRETPLDADELLEGPHRDILARAALHPELGVVTVRRGAGAVALIGGRAFGPDALERAPLSPQFNVEAVRDLLLELPHMPTAGDLVLFGESTGPARTVGFAWEFGSHGGLTHAETDSLIVWPTDAPFRGSGLTHITDLHARLAEAYPQSRIRPHTAVQSGVG